MDSKILRYAINSDPANQNLSKMSAFANGCLLSATNGLNDAFAGMCGLLLTADNQGVLADVFYNNLSALGFKLEPVSVAGFGDLIFGQEEVTTNGLSLKKASLTGRKDGKKMFARFAKNQDLVQIGIALCALGKRVLSEDTLPRWLSYFREAIHIKHIPTSELPSSNVLESIYQFFCARKQFRSELFEAILGISELQTTKPSAIVSTCKVVLRVLKFSELEHLCIISEFVYKRFYGNRNALKGHLKASEDLRVTKCFVNALSSLHMVQCDGSMYYYARLQQPEVLGEGIFNQLLIHLINFANSNVVQYNDNPHPCTKKMLQSCSANGIDKTYQTILKEALKNFEKIAFLYETSEKGLPDLDLLKNGVFRTHKEALSTLVFGYYQMLD